MLVDYSEALYIFANLPASLRAPGLHPFYVVTDALCDPALSPCFFIYREKEKVFYHAFHLGRVAETEFLDIQSPYGYGGPLANTSDELFWQRAQASYVNWCKQNNVLVEFVRFHPLLENWRFYHGVVQEDRQTVWIDLSLEDIWINYAVRVRTAVRKAFKSGLMVDWGNAGYDRINAFVALYHDFLRGINARREYYFCTEYFLNLLRWEKAMLAVCRSADEVVAAAVFLQEDAIMEYHLSASTLQGKKLAATNLLLHEAALLARQFGCKALHLGGGADSSPDSPLLFFKAGFSELRASFKIGWRVYNQQAYDWLKLQYQQTRGAVPAKVLFYRF